MPVSTGRPRRSSGRRRTGSTASQAARCSLGKEHVHYVGYEQIASEVAKIKAAGRTVSAFVYVGHVEEEKGGELIPNVQAKTGKTPATERERYPTIGDAANLAQVSDSGTVAVIGCRVFNGAQALKDAETLKKRKIRVIGSTLYNHGWHMSPSSTRRIPPRLTLTSTRSQGTPAASMSCST